MQALRPVPEIGKGFDWHSGGGVGGDAGERGEGAGRGVASPSLQLSLPS